MRRAAVLLSMLLGMLAARGLAPEALDSWRAWVVFEAWTFDCQSFERFVDLVEGNPGFADLMARRPSRSSVSWVEA
jgi:hypothetical protein